MILRIVKQNTLLHDSRETYMNQNVIYINSIVMRLQVTFKAA